LMRPFLELTRHECRIFATIDVSDDVKRLRLVCILRPRSVFPPLLQN
jgi:hypothetical protein